MYLLVLVGLALTIWPLIISPPFDLEHMRGVVWSVLAAVSLLAALGIRYPLAMLPLLLFELLWKTIWIVAIGIPHWSADQLSPPMAETWRDCLVGVVLLILAMPWRYVVERYVKGKGERWGRGREWLSG
jgi:hypothetical protein